MSQPNIIYLHSHDTGRYIQPYGYPVSTPNLQKFAEQGVLFRNAHCANPTCSPSRACLLTGQYAHQNGMMGLSHRGFEMESFDKHIIHTLHKAGYTSVLGGMQHIYKLAADDAGAKAIGYHRQLAPNTTRADQVAREGIAFLREKHDKPFFLSLGTFETHRVFPNASPANDPNYMRAPAILPDNPQTRQDWANYCTMATQLDEAYGRILGELKATGLDKNTIVICTTDHGIAFPMMKCNLTDHGTGVLLMIKGPAGSAFTGGKIIDAMTSHLDLFPTICDVLGIDRPDWLVGQSLLPLVDGSKSKIHDQLVTTVNTHAATEPMRCVRTTKYSYIRRYLNLPKRILANVDAGESKASLVEQGWRDHLEPEEALFDLVFDPMERNNLAGDKGHADTLAEMRKRLELWQKETGDPLLDGPLKMPPNAILADPRIVNL